MVDLDGDHDADILAAVNDSDPLVWYENDGSQNYVLHVVPTGFAVATKVIGVDLDGDGDTDILAASSFGDQVSWLENDGRAAIYRARSG